MGVSELLPRVPQPPHDPRFPLLDRRTGWRALDLSPAPGLQPAQVRFDGVLTLAAAPGVSRSLLEPSGSFGGLVPPAHVAVAADGAVYLLDAGSLRLLRFDPCCCEFAEVPCFGGEGKAPRQLKSPRGIAIIGNDLYVCDAGNNRVQVLSLRNELGRRPFAALLSPERGQMMDNIQNALNRVARQYGAQIVDVRIKRADLPDGTPLESAYQRMRTAREQEARSIQAPPN